MRYLSLLSLVFVAGCAAASAAPTVDYKAEAAAHLGAAVATQPGTPSVVPAPNVPSKAADPAPAPAVVAPKKQACSNPTCKCPECDGVSCACQAKAKASAPAKAPILNCTQGVQQVSYQGDCSDGSCQSGRSGGGARVYGGGPVRRAGGFFRERRPVRRLIGAPVRFFRNGGFFRRGCR